MNTLIMIFKIIVFWAFVLLLIPFAILMWPFGIRGSVILMRVFAGFTAHLANIKIRVKGKLSRERPLLLVGNHISVFEFVAYPTAFGASFFGKAEIAKMPLVGWFAKRFGVVFVSRNARDAKKVVALINNRVSKSPIPYAIFPEGTTSNGSIILPFKSSMFDFISNGADITVQPVVMHYRDKKWREIDGQTMANDYAYFDNCKQPEGAFKCHTERSAFGQLFHIFKIGGFNIEFTLLEPQKLTGMDRKEIAVKLHEQIKTEFYK